MSYNNPESRDLIPYMDNAQAEGVLSEETRSLLERPSIQRQIMIARGTPASEIAGDDVTFVTILCDDSGSMAVVSDAVIAGHSSVIDALRHAPNPEMIFVSTQLLNAGVIDPYHPLAQAIRLDVMNYIPNEGTPLVPRSIEVFGTVLLKAQEARDEWKTVRTATLIMTDGEDTSNIDPKEVAKVTKDLLSTGRHLVAGMGFGGRSAYFREIFTEMGIDPQWILTAGSSPQDILQGLGLFAKAATKASDEKGFPLLLKSGFGEISRLQGNK